MYPTLFTLGTANLGRHTRRGAGILVMGVSGKLSSFFTSGELPC
jgi:fucose permease